MIRPVGLPILLPAAVLAAVGGGILIFVGILAFAGLLDTLPWLGLLFPLGALLGMAGVLLPFGYDWLRCRTSCDDRVLFAEALADMLDMGIPLDEAAGRLGMDMRANLASSFARTAVAVERAAKGLQQGAPLSAALAATRAFPSRWPTLLAAGERVEDMPGTLRTLARIESRGSSLPLEGLLRTVLVVPLSLGVAGFLAASIIPTFATLFEGMGMDLPLVTRGFLGGMKLLHNPLVGLAVLLGLGLAMLAMLVPSLREGTVVLASRLSWGRLQQQAVFAGSLAAAVRLGVGLPEALEVARASAGDPAYRRAVEGFLRTSGSTLAQMLDSRPDLFEPGLRWMVAQGELYGSLPESLEACAAWLDEEAGRVRHRRGVLLECALVAVVGAFALAMAAGMLGPLADLTVNVLMP